MIRLPAFLSARSCGATIGICRTIQDAEGDVVIDASGLKFADPFGLTLLGASFQELSTWGQRVIVQGLSTDVGGYLRDAIEEFRREAGLADKAGATAARLEWQAKLEEAQALDLKLQAIQEGRHEGAEGGDRDYRILTPWKAPEDRPKGWDPDLDDGVKVNIEPLQKAGVLRAAKVI